MSTDKEYDVIVVLAGGIDDSNQLPQSVKDRIHVAKILFEKKWSSKVLMSGKWSMYRERWQQPTTTEAQAMIEYAKALGLPKSVLLKEEQSRNTVENIQRVGEVFLKRNKWHRVLVVTSDFHLARVRDIVKKYWHHSYQVRYLGARTSVHPWQWLQLRVRETLGLYQQRFLQYFT